MIKRFLASLFVIFVVAIELPWLIVTLFLGAPIFPIIMWIYWVISGKSLSFEQYFNKVVFLPVYKFDDLEIFNKVKQILDWS